jgi:hypothetical protein
MGLLHAVLFRPFIVRRKGGLSIKIFPALRKSSDANLKKQAIETRGSARLRRAWLKIIDYIQGTQPTPPARA